MQPPQLRYFVRVGADVRGPVDEATVAHWLAQGMRSAEICVEGGSEFVPVERTPFARYASQASPGAGFGGRAAKGAGAGTVVIMVLLLGSGRVMHACNRHIDGQKKEIQASLPVPGSKGVLRHDGPMELCPQTKFGWGAPCGHGKSIAQGSHAQVMKAEVFQMEGLCRYWVQDGPDAGAAGDGKCAWFTAD
ncbi:MAG: hypothetical protein QOI41_4731 [Myxococcales bacterium]|jgi:hypothetical protein|nr:hypothetical protein [Myxococcales bacterium]